MASPRRLRAPARSGLGARVAGAVCSRFGLPSVSPVRGLLLPMSVAPEDGQLIRLSDAAMFGVPSASRGLGAHVSIVARVLRDVKGDFELGFQGF